MDRLKCLVIGILTIFSAGCGHTVVETLNVAEGPTLNSPGGGKTVVILPFADYSEGNIESAQRRNMMLTESLTDRLAVNGFALPIQEDVFDYLVTQNIIRLASHDDADTSALDAEIANSDWSERMKDELRIYKEQVESDAAQRDAASLGTHGLSTETVAKIGRHFNADYVLRGRILEYKTRQEATWAPWKRGILPFINGSTSRVINGFASSDEYDERNESLTAALAGGIIGYNTDTFLFGNADDNANAILWGTVGYGMGHVTHTSGQVDQAAVQMRIWVQEAATGNVVWSNRIRVLVSPESVLADNQYDTLFNTAIDKGVTAMVDHFVAYGL